VFFGVKATQLVHHLLSIICSSGLYLLKQSRLRFGPGLWGEKPARAKTEKSKKMNESSTKEQEKRNFTRLRTDTAAEVLIIGRDKRFRAICRDLSGGGMLMETRVGLKPGTGLEVTLSSSYGDTPMLKAHTRVARLEKNAAGNFVLGLEILEILD
jgi:hypothetical protein